MTALLLLRSLIVLAFGIEIRARRLEQQRDDIVPMLSDLPIPAIDTRGRDRPHRPRETTLAMGQISEIRPVAGTDLVGPLPDALQLETVYAAGIAAHAPDPAAARAALGFLRSAEARPAFLAAGFDPPP